MRSDPELHDQNNIWLDRCEAEEKLSFFVTAAVLSQTMPDQSGVWTEILLAQFFVEPTFFLASYVQLKKMARFKSNMAKICKKSI